MAEAVEPAPPSRVATWRATCTLGTTIEPAADDALPVEPLADEPPADEPRPDEPPAVEPVGEPSAALDAESAESVETSLAAPELAPIQSSGGESDD